MKLKPVWYILEIDRPILMFQAFGFKEAQELKKEQWLLDDLRRLTSHGVALWDGKSKLVIRVAMASEATSSIATESSAEDSDELVLTYLLPLDINDEKSARATG